MKKDQLLDLFQTAKLEESQTSSVNGGIYKSKQTHTCVEDSSSPDTTTHTYTYHDTDGEVTSSDHSASRDVMG